MAELCGATTDPEWSVHPCDRVKDHIGIHSWQSLRLNATQFEAADGSVVVTADEAETVREFVRNADFCRDGTPVRDDRCAYDDARAALPSWAKGDAP